MARKLNFMKTVAAGAGVGVGGRSQRRAREAEARKNAARDLEGKTPAQAMALLRRKRNEK